MFSKNTQLVLVRMGLTLAVSDYMAIKLGLRE